MEGVHGGVDELTDIYIYIYIYIDIHALYGGWMGWMYDSLLMDGWLDGCIRLWWIDYWTFARWMGGRIDEKSLPTYSKNGWHTLCTRFKDYPMGYWV